MPYLISARLSVSAASSRLPAAMCNAARRHARRRLGQADLDDCIIEFIETMLARSHDMRRRRGRGFHAWLDRCARNHVEDFCRRGARLHRHETAWPERADEDGNVAPWEPVDKSVSCDGLVLQTECGARIMQAIDRLAPMPRLLFLRHYVEGDSLPDLAQITGKTPDAVRMTLARACKQLRGVLERQGMTEADADEYLAVMRRENAGGGEE